jgi:hypothetical protein
MPVFTDNTIIINTGARNQTGISNFGKTLSKALPQLDRKLVVLWLIDRKRESLELLSDFADAFPEAAIHVVRNMYLGTERKFELYNGSRMRASIEQRGGRSLNFPELADRVTDAMNKGRLTVAQCGYMAGAMLWANSAEGQVAHRLADAGSIRDLAGCDLPGWEPTRDGLCLVRPYKGKTFGWRLPRDAK